MATQIKWNWWPSTPQPNSPFEQLWFLFTRRRWTNTILYIFADKNLLFRSPQSLVMHKSWSWWVVAFSLSCDVSDFVMDASTTCAQPFVLYPTHTNHWSHLAHHPKCAHRARTRLFSGNYALRGCGWSTVCIPLTNVPRANVYIYKYRSTSPPLTSFVRPASSSRMLSFSDFIQCERSCRIRGITRVSWPHLRGGWGYTNGTHINLCENMYSIYVVYIRKKSHFHDNQ